MHFTSASSIGCGFTCIIYARLTHRFSGRPMKIYGQSARNWVLSCNSRTSHFPSIKSTGKVKGASLLLPLSWLYLILEMYLHSFVDLYCILAPIALRMWNATLMRTPWPSKHTLTKSRVTVIRTSRELG